MQIIAIIESHRRIKSKNARTGFCKKKNKKLQATLSKRFIPKITAIFVFCFLLDFTQAIYNERDIRKNKISQTTGKIQFGGVIAVFIEVYHSVSVLGGVKMLPINAKE